MTHDDEVAAARIVRLSGGAMSYREAGHGPPIFLLHGLSGGAGSWHAQLAALAQRHRVIAWDAPGYGDSDPIEATAEAYADAAANLIGALAAGPAAVVGHSMGGIVATMLAHRHPHAVRRLVLSCTHWGSAPPPGEPLAPAYLQRLQERRTRTAKEYGEMRATGMLAPSAPREVFDRVARIAADVSLSGLDAAIRMMGAADNRPLLAQLRLPILLIDADMDRVVGPERTAALAALLPKAHRVTLKGVGHAPYLEDPERFNAAVERFVDS